MTVGDIMNGLGVREFFLNEAGDFIPKAIGKLKEIFEDNPVIDEKFYAMTKTIIDDNFGRLIGTFIDHKKICDNIKDSLFSYLDDKENQAFFIERLSAVPEYPDLPLQGFYEKIGAKKISDILNQTDGSNRFAAILEKLAQYIAGNLHIKEMIEEKINAFAVEDAEAMIFGVINRELNLVMALGGIIGFFIGLLSLLLRFV
jgi:hypothetical protein